MFAYHLENVFKLKPQFKEEMNMEESKGQKKLNWNSKKKS